CDRSLSTQKSPFWRTFMTRTFVIVAGGLIALVAAGCPQDPEKGKRGHTQSGDPYPAPKNYADATLQYRNAPTKDTKSGRSVLQMAKGDLEAAEANLKRAVTVNPDSAEAHVGLANYYWGIKRPADAERELKTAYQLDPKSMKVNRGLAAFYASSDRPAEAEPY